MENDISLERIKEVKSCVEKANTFLTKLNSKREQMVSQLKTSEGELDELGFKTTEKALEHVTDAVSQAEIFVASVDEIQTKIGDKIG